MAHMNLFLLNDGIIALPCWAWTTIRPPEDETFSCLSACSSLADFNNNRQVFTSIWVISIDAYEIYKRANSSGRIHGPRNIYSGVRIKGSKRPVTASSISSPSKIRWTFVGLWMVGLDASMDLRVPEAEHSLQGSFFLPRQSPIRLIASFSQRVDSWATERRFLPANNESGYVKEYIRYYFGLNGAIYLIFLLEFAI